MSGRLISIIGPPAAGKTTVAKALAQRLAARLILEDFAGNPFLAASYKGQHSLDLPAQVYFLLGRVKQLCLASWPADALSVSDYGFDQDALYASQLLGEKDLATYNIVASRVAGLVKPPDVVIHLDASEPTLLKRILRRGREFEQGFEAQFLRRMRLEYAQLETQLSCPVIRIDCDRCDLRQPQPMDQLVAQVESAMNAARR